jgi:Cu+-exporting ATPase
LGAEVETKTFQVQGITCPDCLTRIAKSVERLAGTRKVAGNLARSAVKVTFETDKVSVGEILRAIEDAGYEVAGVEE